MPLPSSLAALPIGTYTIINARLVDAATGRIRTTASAELRQ